MRKVKLKIKKVNSMAVNEVEFLIETYIPLFDGTTSNKQRFVWVCVDNILPGDIIGKSEQFEVLEVIY